MSPIFYMGDFILRVRGHCFAYDAILLVDLFGDGLVEEVSLLRMVRRRERAVEREASWGIIPSRVYGGLAIHVCYVVVEVAAAARAERAGAGS
jgi:hypothetical protein